MIVSQEKSSGRVKMIEKFVDIGNSISMLTCLLGLSAKQLEKISNFNTLMGILGLIHP